MAASLLLAFSACGSSAMAHLQVSEETPAPTPSPTPPLPGKMKPDDSGQTLELSDIHGLQDLELLEEFFPRLPDVEKIIFTSSEPGIKGLEYIHQRYPEAEIDCQFILSGRKIDLASESVAAGGLSHEAAAALAKLLPCMVNLRSVDLGDDSHPFSWEDIAMLEKAAPDAGFEYAFSLYGRDFRLSDKKMSLHHIHITDEGELVRKVISCMPELEYLDMDSTKISDESMAKIRDDFPDIDVVWRVWFGDNYSVRTDVEKILASNPGNGGNLTVSNTKALQYCTKVKYLDVGHNEILHDISFIKYMPDLEVAILAMAYFSDTTPIASCPNLEFLEIQTNEITDLTPLAGLKKLKHLNIAHNYDLCDITPLYGLTQLERLWIGSIDPVPKEQVEEMQKRAPNCVINTEVWDPHAGNWRYDADRESGFSERYELLVKQFGYDSLEYSFYWLDPYYYEDGRIPWRIMDSVYDD